MPPLWVCPCHQMLLIGERRNSENNTMDLAHIPGGVLPKYHEPPVAEIKAINFKQRILYTFTVFG